MLIQTTKKLRDELNLEELEQKERPDLFSWHANFLRINRRKTVVLVNDACEYSVILYGMKKDDLINLPGSPKAVRECLEAVIEIIPHGVKILKGEITEHKPEHK